MRFRVGHRKLVKDAGVRNVLRYQATWKLFRKVLFLIVILSLTFLYQIVLYSVKSLAHD
jgi:hypothetical protein